ncbi:hypothetical protein [Streptomyces sp. NPDC057623]|uniref:hypothetical protein n=1 Tax=Streptomyces sp. NPDC057623 TaxID=3346187 RepID=UPI0036B60CB8
MTYLVFASREDVDWQVEQREMAEILSQEWSDAEIQDQTHADEEVEGRGFRWISHIRGHEVEAWLNKEGTCLYIDGDLDAAAELASWFRRRMPSEVEFAMCDDVYSFQVDVEYGASAREIAASIPD